MKNRIPSAAILERKGKRLTLRFVRIVDHLPDVVWRALTDSATLSRWLPVQQDSRRRTTMFEPFALAIRQGRELTRFELEPHGNGTRVSFAHSYGDLASSARKASEWEHSLVNLERVLAGRRVLTFSAARRSDAFAKHAWEFGPKASAKRLRVA